ncbi:hypothetical protein B296_00045436 [Ensete ventricosum]|uniref:Uncharacterized protein n=1 Tax=Ensete ventricosum TaxID=4639 RepID=A0A426Y9D5_ENSVE|nr:hypothetical protein B296_00045436 [Ensete ventricosum]
MLTASRISLSNPEWSCCFSGLTRPRATGKNLKSNGDMGSRSIVGHTVMENTGNRSHSSIVPRRIKYLGNYSFVRASMVDVGDEKGDCVVAHLILNRSVGIEVRLLIDRSCVHPMRLIVKEETRRNYTEVQTKQGAGESELALRSESKNRRLVRAKDGKRSSEISSGRPDVGSGIPFLLLRVGLFL